MLRLLIGNCRSMLSETRRSTLKTAAYTRTFSAQAVAEAEADQSPSRWSNADESTIGGSFTNIQHRYRKKRAPLNKLTRLIHKAEKKVDLKILVAALGLYQKKGCPLRPETVSLFIKTCCDLEEPALALAALSTRNMKVVHKLNVADGEEHPIIIPQNLSGFLSKTELSPSGLRHVFDYAGKLGLEEDATKAGSDHVEEDSDQATPSEASKLTHGALKVLDTFMAPPSRRVAYSAVRALLNGGDLETAKQFIEALPESPKPSVLKMIADHEEAVAAAELAAKQAAEAEKAAEAAAAAEAAEAAKAEEAAAGEGDVDGKDKE